MKIYLAGPISDLEPDEAEANFLFASMLVTEAGHEPLNPLTMVDQTPGRKYGEYLADALQIMLTQADAVLFLDNWHASRGARIEMFTAGECGIPMYFKADQLPTAEVETVKAV
jgi:nucleoside 2-deoxyribosyltransferase